MAEYRIGDFSLISRISVKALRYYDEEGLLKPSRVDAMTGYRFYDDDSVERARTVRTLRDLDFSVKEIARILPEARDEADIADALTRKASELEDLSRSYGKKAARIRRALERPSLTIECGATPVVSHAREPKRLAAEIRYRGSYSEVGRHFGSIYRSLGRRARGPAFCLYRELSYAEDAEISACIEIAEAPPNAEALREAGIGIIELPCADGLEIVHPGPYSRLGESYSRLFANANDAGLSLVPPVREFYLKGPGLILRGDESRYRTRIFIPLG